MKKLTILSAAMLYMFAVSAQVNQPVDSFFRYYCNTYKSLLDKKGGRNFEEVLNTTSFIAYKQENNRTLVDAKNYIKQQYNIKSDKEAIAKLVEINSERFVHTSLIDLTNGQVLKKYDSIYELINSFACNCITEKTKSMKVIGSWDENEKIGRDCMHQIVTSPAIFQIRKLSANINQTQLKEMSDNVDLYMFIHCPFFTTEWIREEKNGVAGLYDNHLSWEPYTVMDNVEKFIQKTDTITTIERYFVSEAAYKATVNQLNLWRKAFQLKNYIGRSYDYRYSIKNVTEFYKIYTTRESGDMDIAFMIKYVFKSPGDRRIVSISYIEGDKVPQKEKVINDLYKGKSVGDDTKTIAAPSHKKN